jgi:two-component system response regulator RpfG
VIPPLGGKTGPSKPENSGINCALDDGIRHMTTILVIDDQATSRQILSQIIRSIDSTLKIELFEEAASALAWLQSSPADLILTDYKMPGMDGIAFLERARALPTARHVPVIMITSHEQSDIRYRALELGATDFLSKPVDHIECRARFNNLLRLQRQRLIIEDRAKWLEEKVKEATEAIRLREHETLLRLARAGEYRDEETGNHVVRMARYARLIAEHLKLDDEECEAIELAAPMHDIGKIGVPDQILRKPGRLSAEEYEVIKQHPRIGFEILKDSPSKYLQLGAVIALGHHEKFNGGGYPNGLEGEAIPLAARIVAVADVFDALSSRRCYKTAWSNEEILKFLQAQRGGHFDPQCVNAFVTRFEDVLKIQEMFQDDEDDSDDQRNLNALIL